MLNFNYEFDADGERVVCELLLNHEKIGSSEVYLIKGGEYLAGYIEQSDEYCSWVPMDAMYSIEFNGYSGIHKNIGLIQNILIHNDYRGFGYGSYFLQQIEEFTKKNKMETMILQPYPLEREDSSFHFSRVESLADLYESKGYTVCETVKTMDSPYYFKNL